MIKWESRISKDDKYIDMQGMPYYLMTFGENSKKEIIYDIECWIPEEPDDTDCINWGLPEENQIFRLTFVPDQVRYREKDFGRANWTEREIDAFIDFEWNRRRNGLWFWIKGVKTYIPGELWFKMNHWKDSTGKQFFYKSSDRRMFVVLQNATYHPKCKGIADFKCRQLGDTVNTLVYMYSRGSRIRGTTHTMQSCINEDHIIGAYERLVHGHTNMVYYFRPMNRGTESPKKGLHLDYPPKSLTHAEIQRQRDAGGIINKSSLEEYQHPPLKSIFKYGTSKVSRFDGTTGVSTAYLDEFGKATELNPIEWIQVMAEATFDSNRGVKAGMEILTSTIEEISENSLDWAQIIYQESDPNKLLSSGNTVNGLWRIFRGASERGFETFVTDKWGDIDSEAVIRAITEKYNAMVEAGNRRGALSFLRKNPRTIEDVFLTTKNDSPFHTENMSKRLFYLTEVASPKPYVIGNFRWKDGIRDTTVIWEPNPKGDFMVSKHPHDFGLEDNDRVSNINAPKPANTAYFCSGIDPIDQNETIASESERSKGAFVIMRRPDQSVDSAESLYYQFNDDIQGIQKGMPVDLGSNMQTNRVCCTYMKRPEDPNEFFEAVIMAHVYYGSDFLPEKNKYGGLKVYLKMRGYALYEMDKPTDVKNHKGQTEKGGVTATENSINMYFDFITSYSCTMANAIDHPDLLKQLIGMNWKNKTRLDMGVAFGWCLYAGTQKRNRWHGDRQKKEIRHFVDNIV